MSQLGFQVTLMMQKYGISTDWKHFKILLNSAGFTQKQPETPYPTKNKGAGGRPTKESELHAMPSKLTSQLPPSTANFLRKNP